MLPRKFRLRSDVYYVGYDDKDYAEIHFAETFKDLAVVAMRILPRLDQPLGLISGPITSGGFWDRAANLTLFQAHIEALKLLGVSLFDQMPMERQFERIIESPYFKNQDQLLEEFYGPVLDSGFIKTLFSCPGAHTSYGARWEHARASKNRISIVHIPCDFRP